MLKALLWDIDGTLAETERDGHRVAFNRAFAEAGLGWHWDVARYGELLAVTGGRERMLHDWRCRHPGEQPSASWIDRIAALHAHKNRLYAQIVRSGRIALRPGVAALVDEARRAGLRQALVTTTSRENGEALLEIHAARLGPQASFDAAVYGEDVRRKKPDPEAYRLALARLSLRPHEAVALEDSLAGLQAATAAGIACLVTCAVYTPRLAIRTSGLLPLAMTGDLDEPGEAGPQGVDLATLRRLHAARR